VALFPAGLRKLVPLIVLGAPLAVTSTADAAVSFDKRTLQGTSLVAPTSLQFGPDGRLYVSQQNGTILAYQIDRSATGAYSVDSTEVINLVRNIPNHDDDGDPNSGVTNRLVTGILVTGTAQSPVLYVSSSDPRIGGGMNATDRNVDSNSGIISRLTKSGSSWSKVDLVRGLPRSQENHGPNGMVLDQQTNTLYIAVGGHTNMGAPSNNFVFVPEYALSAAILSVDLDAIGNMTYDLPTLDDETRAGANDANDPFGGNDGKNQARLVEGGPVQVYAPGFRNAYDVVITEVGRMYTIDNGPNAGWGGMPIGEGTSNCTNEVSEPGVTHIDNLHHIPGPGYYGGHPNPTRARRANTFNASNPQSPVPVSNPVECDYRTPGEDDGALATFRRSTNGLVEYTASNFGGEMRGDLLTASFDNQIWRIRLNSAGTATTSVTPLFSSVGANPLDVTAQADDRIFPGTIWAADHELDAIFVYEPTDLDTCTGADRSDLDEDDDGFNNADEIDNATDPCSAADFPPDVDGDFLSDRNDADDDNDEMLDTEDPFAIDATNGAVTPIPVSYGWENDDPPAGGLLDLGFTGLMTNGADDYAILYDGDEMTAGGAAGVVTVDAVPEGDALGGLNTQEFAFQFGAMIPGELDDVVAHTRIVAPFLGIEPEASQSMGLFVGNGDQDNYFKVVVSSGQGDGGVESLLEVNGNAVPGVSDVIFLPGPSAIDLYIAVDVVQRTARAAYSLSDGGFIGDIILLGEPVDIPASWLTDPVVGLAVGIISTSRGPGPGFAATWDFIEIDDQPLSIVTTTTTTTTSTTLSTPTSSTSTTTTLPVTTTTLPEPAACGDGDGNGRINAVDALVTLRAAIGDGECTVCVCDVDASGTIAATDALVLLRVVVGVGGRLDCTACS